MNQKLAEAQEQFITVFGTHPQVIKAPGRINIIGEHTDYNDGLVLPAATNLAVYILIQKRDDQICNLRALDVNESYTFSVTEKLHPVEQDWSNYFLGVLDELLNMNHHVGGFDLMFLSDIPIGAGLSSSAALECGFAFALSALFELNIDLKTIAKIGQSAEHRFVGVQCGIMDQYASCMGRHNHAIKLDCKTLSHEYIPVEFEEYEFILFDSRVKHNLVDTQYNLRREQCETGLRAIQENHPNINSLREATLTDLESVKCTIEDSVYNRCHFVINEIVRVEEACLALSQRDAVRLGGLLTETHTGLRDLYEVSCKELDILVDIASRCEGYLGGRMMGGGFGGCTINLIEKSHREAIVEKVKTVYQISTGIETKVYHVSIGNGVEVVNLKAINEV